MTVAPASPPAAELAAAVLACLSDALVVTDLAGRIVLFNAAAERLYGVPVGDVAGRRVTDALVHPDAGADGIGWPLLPATVEVAAGPLHAPHRRADGTRFDAEINLVPVCDPDGAVLGLAGIVRDVTGLLAERAGASALRAVVDAAAEAIVAVDEDGRAVAERNLAEDRQVVETGVPMTFTKDTRIAGGDSRSYLITKFPIAGPDRDPDGVGVVASDISELRRGEADSARLAALVRAAPDAIITEDCDAVIATWNPGAERMFGLTAEQAVGRPYDAVVVPESERDAFRELRAQVFEGHTVTVRMGGRRADGSLFPTEVSAAPLTAADGSRTGAVAIVRDITELTEAELDLRERACQLERSNHDLEEFAYAASHDLQEPLRSIKMGAETVMHSAAERLDGDERALLAHVDAATTRMSAQVEALMELARVTLGEGAEAPVPVQLPLDDALDGLRAAILETDAAIEVDGRLPSAAVPRAELTLVLQNLLANAIKYRRPDTRPRVRVSGSAGDEYVEVRIADNGIGLSEADRAHIFAIFGRADPEVDGTGMGLALCRRILERRAGSISVASAGPDRGSEFTLRLPAGDSVRSA